MYIRKPFALKGFKKMALSDTANRLEIFQIMTSAFLDDFEVYLKEIFN